MERTVLEIDVQDEKFRKFLSAFGDFQESVGELPAAWRKAFDAVKMPDKKISKAQKSVEGMAHSAKKLDKLFARSAHGMTALGKATNKTAHAMKSLLGIATKLSAAGLALGGIAGAGSLFGMDELANIAMSRRMQAKVTGMSTGKLAALQVAMRPILGSPDAVAAKMAEARNSVAGQSFLARTVGPGWQSMGRMQSYFALVNRAQHLMKTAAPGTGLTQAGALGYTHFLSTPDLLRLKNTKTKTLMGYEAMAWHNRHALGFSNRTAREWTALAMQLNKAKVLIETDLIRSLSKLAKPIGKLTQEFSSWVSAGLKSKDFAAMIGEADTGLKSLAKFLDSKQFQNDVSTVWKDIRQIGDASVVAADAILRAARILGFHPSGKHGNFGFASPKGNPFNWSKGYTGHHHTAFSSRFGIPFGGTENKYEGPDYWKRNPLNPAASWRVRHNPMNIEGAGPGGHAGRFAIFKTDAQSYREAARRLIGYQKHGAHSIFSLVKDFEAGPNATKKQMAENNVAAHAAAIAAMLGAKSADQDVTLNQKNLATLTYGLAKFEEPRKRSDRDLHETIANAIEAGLKRGTIHLSVHDQAGARLNVGAYAASVGP